MSLLLKKAIAFAQIVLIASPVALYSSYAQAGCAKCDEYAAYINQCKGQQTASCTPEEIQKKWGMTSTYCAAASQADEAKDASLVTASVYTAAAAVCTTACATEWMGGITKAACVIGGGAAGITDLIESSLLGDTGGQVVGSLAMAASAATLAVSLGAAGLQAQNTINTVLMKSQTWSCWAAGIFAVIAGLKWYTMADSQGKSGDACKNASKLNSDANGTDGNNNGNNTVHGLQPSNINSFGGGGSGSTMSPTVSNALADPSQFPSGTLSAAGAGPDIFGKFPNKEKFQEALNKLGIDPQGIANQLQSGNSPSSILSGMNGLSDGMKKAFSDMDQAIKDGKIQLQGAAGNYSGGSGGGGAPAAGAANANPFGDLSGLLGSKKDGDNKDAGNTLKFGRSTASIADGSDIWHTSFKGSIFQIVSQRIDKSRDKVQAGEWSTPLNRALMGLPPQKTGTALK